MDKFKNFLLDEDFIKWRLFRTEEQNAQWEKFRHENPHFEQNIKDAIVQFNALEVTKYTLPQDEKDALYSLVMQKINKRRSRYSFLQYASSIAVVLAIGIVSTFFLKLHKGNLLHTPIDNSTISGQTLQEEEVYIISGNNKINLTNNSNIELTQNEKVVVTDSAKSKQELRLATAAMNKLVVPFGKRSILTLVDGTKVWLNSGTQVDFPSRFDGNTREITVNGEVFIEVSKDAQKRFVVHTANMDIQVFGTSFNLSAYDDDITKTVVLVNGSVAVKTDGFETKLEPNQKLEVTNGEFTKENVDVSEYISWTRGVLEFNETPVSEILKKVGRYYNVQFDNSSGISLKDKTCSGKLFLSSNLDSVMVSITHLSSTKYQRKNNIIHISKD